jgi:hypothetical protein
MSSREPTTPAESQVPVANTDWAVLLSSEDIANLAGFFGVLIEMDLEQKQRNTKGVRDEATTQNNIKSKPPVN